MKLLGIDFGLSRIGIAVGTTESGIAFPRQILQRQGHFMEIIATLVKDEAIDAIVVGMPLKRDGSRGDIFAELDDFVDELRELTGKEVILYDERYTSKLAEHRLSKGGMKLKDQKDIADSIAAQIILQEWLDEQAV